MRSCLLKLLELFPYLSLGRRLLPTPRAQHRARPRVQLLPEEQGALRPPGCRLLPAFPPTLAPPHPSSPSPSPQSLLQTKLQGSPQPHTPTSYKYSLPGVKFPACRIRFSLFPSRADLNWLILKHFFFHESYHVICTASH